MAVFPFAVAFMLPLVLVVKDPLSPIFLMTPVTVAFDYCILCFVEGIVTIHEGANGSLVFVHCLVMTPAVPHGCV